MHRQISSSNGLETHRLTHIPQPAFAQQRLLELDWLRVIAFGVLILYHTGMLYAAGQGWGWHFKSEYSSRALTYLMLWSNQWRMALLFMISGAACAFLLAKQARWVFVRRRVLLLLLPLIFGVLVVVVPQVYVEFNYKGWGNEPNYWHFWYAYLDQTSPEFAQHKTLGAMQLTWNHLWFLPYMLAYSLVLWAVYPLLISPRLAAIKHFLASRLSIKWVVIAPIAVSYTLGSLLEDAHPVTLNFVQDWFNHARSFLVFVIGFTLVQLPSLWQRLRFYRMHFLTMAIISFSYIVFSYSGGHLGDNSFARCVNHVFWTANGWFWILTLIGFAQHWGAKSNPLLRYLNSGVYCFYVLHQTLIIALAYWLAAYHLGPVVEPLTIILLVGMGCILGFEIAKRVPVFGVMLGVWR